MKRLFCFLMCLTGLILVSSCNKWLDIQPKSAVAADDLFKTEAGFEEALNGVYIRCGSQDLYGDELTCGMLDVMAQNFTLSTTIDQWHYLPTQKFNYKDADFISRRDQLWGGLYNAIVNVNLILENIDAKKAIFTDHHYELIKGEALGLRAFIHFDLFRMFGAAPNGQNRTIGIPYVTTYSNKVTRTFSASEVLAAIEKDLSEAKALLGPVDPIVTKGYIIDYPGSDSTTEDSDPALFMQKRRNRMNYYAVTATAARVYLYEGKKADALKSAQEVIKADKFPWTTQADFINSDAKKQDLILYKEMIFGWYEPWMIARLKSRFESGLGGLYISQDDAQHIYETNGIGGDDLRYKEWFQVGVNRNMEFREYARNPDGDPDDPASDLYPQTLPAIRLSEMYYIAAECTYDQNQAAALSLMDEVRSQRGIGTKMKAATKEVFINELLKEARKEFFGTGQIFYMYKRLGKGILGQSGVQLPATDQIFVLPIPNNEIEFGNR
ncbi:MAG TPA: RagB/SusD family nutrient uptake outer membrane protein [Arachidicoccus sp.]|nr:RagB/SusD family nutrient uptake outer membrane protein [Arachidicoccus sp.]